MKRIEKASEWYGFDYTRPQLARQQTKEWAQAKTAIDVQKRSKEQLITDIEQDPEFTDTQKSLYKENVISDRTFGGYHSQRAEDSMHIADQLSAREEEQLAMLDENGMRIKPDQLDGPAEQFNGFRRRTPGADREARSPRHQVQSDRRWKWRQMNRLAVVDGRYPHHDDRIPCAGVWIRWGSLPTDANMTPIRRGSISGRARPAVLLAVVVDSRPITTFLRPQIWDRTNNRTGPNERRTNHFPTSETALATHSRA